MQSTNFESVLIVTSFLIKFQCDEGDHFCLYSLQERDGLVGKLLLFNGEVVDFYL